MEPQAAHCPPIGKRYVRTSPQSGSDESILPKGRLQEGGEKRALTSLQRKQGQEKT